MIPLVSTDAELALFPAWQDGLPWLGPGIVRGAEVPLLRCHGSFSARELSASAETEGFDSRGVQASAMVPSWDVEVEVPDGIREDDWSVLPSRLPDGGWMILVIRFFEAEHGRWRLLRFFHVAGGGDDISDSGESVRRTMRFRCGYLQEIGGFSSMPDMRPVVLGEVEWRCGPRRVVAWTFDPETETWASTPDNETGDGGTRYVQIAMAEDAETDLLLAAYFPRAVDSYPSGILPRKNIQWCNTFIARIASHESEWGHGMQLFGLNVQTAGVPEPVAMVPQSRMLEEPVIVFRFLSRIYATIGHGVLAVPALATNEVPPLTHDPVFVLAAPGPPNPITGFSGLVMMPNGAWLDGALIIPPPIIPPSIIITPPPFPPPP